MKNQILNILVAGCGGQGVFTLSNLLREMAINKGFSCEGATFKGGAQRMGTVYSEIRISTTINNERIFSSQIPKGAVDVLISMEPWEALRFANRCNNNTKSIINSQEEKLYVERFQKTPLINPIESLEKVFNAPIIKNYTQYTKEQLGDTKFTNYIMLEDSILKGYLPFTVEELEAINIKK
jgi:indolepyruvate ferredoxin oxidoreductase, beta subunit